MLDAPDINRIVLASYTLTTAIDLWKVWRVLCLRARLEREREEQEGVLPGAAGLQQLGALARGRVAHRARAPRAPRARTSPPTRARACLLYTSPRPRDGLLWRMPSSA